MNSKTKFTVTITALCIVTILAVIAVVTAFLYGAIKVSNFSFGFKTGQNINGSVSVTYSFADQVIYMTTDGTSGGDKMLNYNGESEDQHKQLKILNNEVIKLTQENNNIVFCYRFTNSDTIKSYFVYVSYTDTQKTDSNMTMLWGYTNSIVQNFDDIENKDPQNTDIFDMTSNPIMGLEVKPKSIVYLYIKAKITNPGDNAELSGDFLIELK